MKINLEYKRKANESDKLSDPELTFDYISFAVNQKYREGLDGQMRRLWGRIQRKFDEAIDNLKGTVDLEESEKDFIRKAFDECKYPTHTAKYVAVLENEIDKFKEEEKKEEKKEDKKK